jgi:hypothetical protein
VFAQVGECVWSLPTKIASGVLAILLAEVGCKIPTFYPYFVGDRWTGRDSLLCTYRKLLAVLLAIGGFYFHKLLNMSILKRADGEGFAGLLPLATQKLKQVLPLYASKLTSN